jgi:hypothetical protein
MDTRLVEMKRRVRSGEHKHYRQGQTPDVLAECEAAGLSWPARVARLTRRMCEAQRPVIEPDQQIVFTRTTPDLPVIYSPEDWAQLTAGHTLHELGPISNICTDWGAVLSQGLLRRKEAALSTRARLADDAEATEFLDSALETIDAVLGLAAAYAEAARQAGRPEIAAMLDHVPANPPRTFHEALQALRLLHAVVWPSSLSA